MNRSHADTQHDMHPPTAITTSAPTYTGENDDEDENGCVVDLSYQSYTGHEEEEAAGASPVEETVEEETGVDNIHISSDWEAEEEEGDMAYNSPPPRAGGGSTGGDDPKTPSLEAWKLSHATRHILDQQKYISRGADKSPGDDLLQRSVAKGKSHTVKNYSNAQVVTRAQAATPPSPNHVDMSTSYVRRSNQTENSTAVIDAVASSSQLFDTSINASVILDDGDPMIDMSTASPIGTPGVARNEGAKFLSTPIDEAREILRAHAQLDYSALSNSPGTPTFGGEAPVTCQILDKLAGDKKDISMHSKAAAATNESDDDHMDSSYHSCNNSDCGAGPALMDTSIANSDDGLLDPSSLSKAFASPPTAVRVLNPRRGEKAIAADAENGWIPLVCEDEWKSAPSFLRMQFGLSDINETLTLLNKFIAENLTKTESGFSKRLETFSFDEIVRIVGSSIGSAPIKVVVLGLVHFKKLDVGTENSVKVYKIRRFY